MSTPTCSGRYPGCGEGGSFPAVTNYDYPGNLSVRGINDREFTWEEVIGTPNYNYQEATTNGYLGNSYVADNTPSNVTGVNYITNISSLSDSSTYTGWTLTGTSTVYIGTSGIIVNSGELTGLTGSFRANPIEGNESVGLYVEPDSASNRPQIISDIIEDEEGGVIPDGRHQMYLVARSAYGSSSLKFYVIGYVGATPVAYFDPSSLSWQFSAPDYAFPVGISGYTEIQYNFTAADYPGVTPTTFRVVVESYATGTFVVVDDIHLDAYLKEDPYSTYSLPTGYLIQITPDLGWHNQIALFESTQDEVNPHLKTIGIFTIAGGNLRDNLDNSVTAILDANQLDDITSDTYKKYLWRAIPVSANGDLGPGGIPRQFTYIGSQLDDFFTIDSVDSSKTSIIKTIYGSKSDRMTVLVNGDDDYPGLEYPNLTSWKLVYSLKSPKEIVTLQARDSGGALTSERFVELSSKLYNTNYQALWNVFDEHGLVADTQRLPKESNTDYAKRIKDAYINRGGAFFEGVVNGATRELGLSKLPDAILIRPYLEQDKPVSTGINLRVTSYSVQLFTSQTIFEESVYVDPIYKTVDLTYLPRDLPITISIEGKDDIELSKVEIYESETDPYAKKYVIHDPVALGRIVTIRYPFAYELLFRDYKTIDELVIKLNTLKAFTKPIVVASKNAVLSGNEDTFGLYLASTVINRDGVTLAWSPVYLKKMSDRGYREYFIKDNITYRQSKYYEFVKELQTNTRVFWGSVEADRDFWDAADSKDLSFDTIPTLFDPPLTQFQSYTNDGYITIKPISAWGRNYTGLQNEVLINLGLTNTLLQPGVGTKRDLEPEIYTDFRLTKTKEEFFNNIPPSRFNNNTGLFTGQL